MLLINIGTLCMGDDMENYQRMIEYFNQKLRINENFDIVSKALQIQNIHIHLYFVDGLIKDEILERMLAFLLNSKIEKSVKNDSIEIFCSKWLSYLEVNVENRFDQAIVGVLSGSLMMVIENYNDVIMIDARVYPIRSMQEPEDDRVLRGSRDGFVETMIFNTALIRRRIRDCRLTMTYMNVGSQSKTDIVLCYMEHIADKKLIDLLKNRISNIQVEALTMGQESLAEALVLHHWWNPFPKVRYSERPDCASSQLLEGKVILIVDNCPSVLILPTTIFDFIQEAQDYYLPPITGNYLRMIRILVVLASLFFTPLWFYLNSNPSLCPHWLQFALVLESTNIPIIFQLLLLEIGIDAIKLASLNTPTGLNGSFSIIGALILGDFAVNSGWLDSKVLLYMAFVALANFVQTSFELTYAVKFIRIMMLVLIAVMPSLGLWIGMILLIVIMFKNQTITKTSYFYPLIPFRYQQLKKVFIRTKLK